ncbi:MAG: hypothetical protein QOI98_2843, partial [Solirubrobacteraceae bacterium]|nr:hypothetical protein [Solirubrobacteraceae bacterium]
MRQRGVYQVVALGLLAATSGVALFATVALAPDLGASLGDTPKSIASLARMQSLLVVLAVLALAVAVHQRPAAARMAL